MNVGSLLGDLFARVDEHVEEVLDGLDPAGLMWQPGTGTNPIGWLVWHVARVEDAQIADLLGETQLWATGPWAPRFGLEPDPGNSGYGHTAADVAAVRPESVDALREYAQAARSRTDAFLEGLTADDLDRVVDAAWDPPVTMGVRLISIADDEIQHLGAAAYVKGLLQQ